MHSELLCSRLNVNFFSLFSVDDNDSSSEQQSNGNDVEKDAEMQSNNQQISHSMPNNSALNIAVRNIDSLKTSNHHQQNSQSPTNSCLRNNSTNSATSSAILAAAAMNSGVNNAAAAGANSVVPIDSESQSSIQNNSYMRRVPYKKSRHTFSDKYEAFGNFIATSLTDLSEEKALKLIEKFTGDIVKALLLQANQN